MRLHNYHKLPGGGIDEGETPEQALHREFKEEIGCDAEILAELGEIIEYRDFFEMKQTSYTYLCRQVGRKASNQLEELEIEEQMSEVLAKNINEAIKLPENDKPKNEEGCFIQLRDLTILKAAKKEMKKLNLH